MSVSQHREVRLEVAADAGLRLRRWLDEHPTVTDLARESGLSRQHVHEVLRGRARPSPDLIAAAIRLGVPASVFEVRGRR